MKDSGRFAGYNRVVCLHCMGLAGQERFDVTSIKSVGSNVVKTLQSRGTDAI